jgi:hypothetical protein
MSIICRCEDAGIPFTSGVSAVTQKVTRVVSAWSKAHKLWNSTGNGTTNEELDADEPGISGGERLIRMNNRQKRATFVEKFETKNPYYRTLLPVLGSRYLHSPVLVIDSTRPDTQTLESQLGIQGDEDDGFNDSGVVGATPRYTTPYSLRTSIADKQPILPYSFHTPPRNASPGPSSAPTPALNNTFGGALGDMEDDEYLARVMRDDYDPTDDEDEGETPQTRNTSTSTTPSLRQPSPAQSVQSTRSAGSSACRVSNQVRPPA